MKRLTFCLVFLATAGCAVEPPKSPMEKHARLAAAAEVAVQNCGGAVGGYASAQELKADANQNIATARKLGATDADIQKARSDVLNAFNLAASFGTPQEACNQLVGQIAWNTN